MLAENPFLSVLLENSAPSVEVLEVRVDPSDLTTYTFSGCTINLGGVASTSGDDYLVNPQARSRSRSAIVIFIHARHTSVAYTVSSCTIGAVGGTELNDIKSDLNAATATYLWDTAALGGITNTDVVVTFSTAITGCVIGILKVNDIGVLKNVVDFNLSSNPEVVVGFDITNLQTEHNSVFMVGVTADNVGTTSIRGGDTVQDPARPFSLLYEGTNVDYTYAAYWTYSPQYNESNSHAAVGYVGLSTATNVNAISLGFV